jgi:hypothetical protein
LKELAVIALCRQKHATHRNGSRERARNVVFGGTHDVEVIGSGVGDHTVGSADELRFGQPLKLRLKRHAFDDERFGALRGRHGDRLLLLDDIRTTRPIDWNLAAIRQDESRNRASRLGYATDAGFAKAGGDQARDARLTAGAVHVDTDRNPRKAPSVQN